MRDVSNSVEKVPRTPFYIYLYAVLTEGFIVLSYFQDHHKHKLYSFIVPGLLPLLAVLAGNFSMTRKKPKEGARR